MPRLKQSLGGLDAVALSVSIIAPALAMAVTTPFAVQSSGRAAPLAFLLGAVAIGIVGLSFVSFSRRIVHAGSVYAYVSQAFGRQTGFVAGWALLLTYLSFTAGTIAMIGVFTTAALVQVSIQIPGGWVGPSVIGAVLATWLAWRDMHVAARLMLALEGIAALAILILAVAILMHAPLSMAPFVPARTVGWGGVGLAMVFAITSFAGFEGAATLGEEVRDPRRTIPWAVMGTILFVGLFFLIVSYAQVIGYGLDHTADLAQAEAPLDTLAARYLSHGYAVFMDVAAATSAFACVIGATSAAARMLFALGREARASWFEQVHPAYGTPSHAVLAIGGVSLIALLLWAVPYKPTDYTGAALTIGALALILVYMTVTGAEMANAFGRRQFARASIGLAGTLLLAWPLWSSIFPLKPWPALLWPLLVLAWIILGVLLTVSRPMLRGPSGGLCQRKLTAGRVGG